MLATLLTKATIAAIALLLLLVINRKRILSFTLPLILFFLVYFADNFLIIFSNQYPSLQLIPNHIWEGFLVCSWSGKLYSIIFTLVVIYLSRHLLGFGELGITFHQASRSILPAALVTLALAGWAAYIGLKSPKGVFDAQTLAYLAIMPGINEELVYRGYLQGMLNKLMPKKFNIIGAGIGWGAVIATIVFGLLHGLWFDNHLSIHFDVIAITNSLFTGFVFAWLRERTGSLLMPVIAHGLVDFLFFLPRMI